MRKLFLCIAAAIGFGSYAQTDIATESIMDTTANWLSKKHELKLGSLKLLGGAIVEVTYEYIYSNDFTFGASALANLDRNNDYNEDFSFTPFARVYFQDPKRYKARGFFLEGSLKYINGHQSHYYYTDRYDPVLDYYERISEYRDRESFNAAAVGLAAGMKWINRSGFVFEILLGIGRNISGNTDVAPEAFFRGDFNLGYRF